MNETLLSLHCLPNRFIDIPADVALFGMDVSESEHLETRYKEEVLGVGRIYRKQMPAFQILVFPVTVGEYVRFLAATGRDLPACDIREHSYRYPVTGVTREEASAYADWIDAALPSEEEWEYAARGSDGRVVPWGFGEKKQLMHRKRLFRVGQLRSLASPFGVHDMMGLVSEWTSSTEGDCAIAKGCPVVMKCMHAGRRFLLDPNHRWAWTGFRCVRRRVRSTRLRSEQTEEDLQ